MENRFATLREIAAELNCSHETARRAALQGKLPAFQPFGKGTTWCVASNWESFLGKSRQGGADGSARSAGGTSDDTVKHG